MSVLVLPGSLSLDNTLIREKFSAIEQYKPLEGHPTTFDLINHIKSLSFTPQAIIGSTQTPVVDWLASQHLYPKADIYLQQTANEKLQIRKIDSLELMDWIEPKLENKNTISSTNNSTVTSNKSNISQKSTSITDSSDNDLLYQVFLKTSWGGEDNRSAISRSVAEINKRILKKPHLLKQLKKSEHDGTVAFQGVQLLKAKMRGKYNLQELDVWINTKYQKEANRVISSIKKALKKEDTFRKKKKKVSKKTNYQCKLPPIFIKNEKHPNALINLPESKVYNVYIDETGDNFSTQSQKEKMTGKYVAIVLPDSTNLPKLKNFHATDESPERIDEAVSKLMSNEVGIIGFSSIDNKIQKSIGWLNGIVQLVRWIAYLLPYSENCSHVLNVVIEQRGDFTQNIDLRILEDLMFDELRTLDKKFEQLSIKLQFAGKDHPYLTYADAIALTWGGKSKTNKIRLEKSKLEGYCLLSATDDTIEKLYLMANSEFKLTTQEWFKLCADLPSNNTSWLNRYMEKIKDKVKCDQGIWLKYLGYVRELLALKNYNTNEIFNALCFLEQSRPADCDLSIELQLRLISTKLSVTSHLGVMDDNLYIEAVDLINIIKKEDTQLASEGLLRLFSMTTNTFESEKIAAIVQVWLKQPPLITGKLNFAKLHSTMGQIFAFDHKNKEAVSSFNTAIQFFNELSGKPQAKKEISQTYCYLLMAYLTDDNRQGEAIKLVIRLLTLFDNKIENMASSTSYPYVHHCILKAITLRPQWFSDLHNQYLECASQWTSDFEHPWQWVKLYRGLMTITKNEDDGLSLCHEAFQDCIGKGAIFEWMQLVMQQLILQFDDFMTEIDQDDIENIRHKLSKAPVEHLLQQTGVDISNIRIWLNMVLPFNFH